MTTVMNVNRSVNDVVRRPVPVTTDNDVYLWLIIGCSVGGVVLVTLGIVLVLYLRRRTKRKKKKTNLLGSGFIPGSDFCPQQMISSFSSTTSDSASEATSPVERQFRRPLGPSSSLEPPGLLRLTTSSVQPRPTLTRWHTVATPHSQTAAVSGTLDLRKDSDEEDTRNPPCIHGRLWFSLLYNQEAKKLQVNLIKAKYLPGRGLSNSPRDPFVKVFLLPDEENFHQSKIRKRTLDPKFNEMFEFNVSEDDLVKRTLKLSVYDVDKKKVRHCLGHVLLTLAQEDVTSGDIVWRDLELASQAAVTLGELQLSLSCNPSSNRIKTNIGRLKNLQGNLPDNAVLYVKVQLYHGRKVIKVKRTVPQTHSPETIFDETFSFGVSGRFFDSCSFSFSVILASPTPGLRDRIHGRVVIGPFMYARGDQLQHWQEMLSNPRSSIMRWHPLEPVRAH